MTPLTTNEKLEAALTYADLGYAVFPCKPGSKEPITEHGFHDASTDADQIEEWWKKHPDACIGIAAEGLLVVDIDGANNPWPNDPNKSLELANGPTSLTPRGGKHHIFRRPTGKAWRNTAGKLAEHVDTRTDGGYIVVPPSSRPDGHYRWIEGCELDGPLDRLPEPPAWLIEQLDELGRPETNGAATIDGNDIPSGQRNDTLARLAGSMRRVGMNESEICAAIQEANRGRCKPQLGDHEVKKIAWSVSRYEPDQFSVAVAENHYGQLFEPKDFRQRRPKPGGGWTWSVKGVRVVPYRLPELLADPTESVFVTEGEKDCDNLASIGVLATCNAGGAGKWTAEHSAFLRGRRIIVLPDNDKAGRDHAQKVSRLLHGIAASVRIVELPGLAEKGDASDWIAAGGTKEELTRLAEAVPDWSPDAQPWPKVVSLETLDLPDFPTHALPDVLRNWVEAESHATQTPADLAALLALSICAAGIARHVVVQPRPGWTEPVNLFAAVLLEPGNRKSAVFADAMKPIRELEAELIKSARPKVARSQSERRQKESQMKKLEKVAAEKGDDEAGREAGDIAAMLAEQPEPVLPRLIVDDATAEKLGIMLAEQDGRIGSMSPEGGVFDLMAGLYSKNGIPQFGVYLKGHAGDDLVTDRVSRESVRVERPALTCAYAIQPAVIEGLASMPAFRGRGLLARFLYSFPRSWIGGRKIGADPVCDATWEEYRAAVRGLAEVEGDEFVLQLSPDASALFLDWEAEIETMLADGGQMEIMRDWGAKLAGATLRMAAILHCVECGTEGYIEGPTIVAAVEIARYLIPHAEAVLNTMAATEDTASHDARYVLRWINRHGRREFTKSQAQHHGKRRFQHAEDIDPALEELEHRGYIRLRPAETTCPGRPPSPTYEVNPSLFSNENTEKRSQYSRNADREPENGNCGNNGSAFRQVENESRGQAEVVI